MSITIRESFDVQAPLDRVWRFLIDPRQVVECLPGAELTEIVDARTFRGRVKIKVGPVTAAYDGTATLTEVNDVEHRVRIAAEGRESSGSGGAKMTMTSTVTARPDGSCAVQVDAELDVAGKIVQFGRGMIESVNKQLFRQFTECVRARLAAPESGPAADPTPGRAAMPPAPAPAPAPAEPVNALSLLAAMIRDWISKLFHRGARG